MLTALLAVHHHQLCDGESQMGPLSAHPSFSMATSLFCLTVHCISEDLVQRTQEVMSAQQVIVWELIKGQ